MQYPQIDKVILYGSRATGTYRNGSDIDLTFCGEGLTHKVLTKIDNDLDDLLLPYTIDISDFSNITQVATYVYLDTETPSLMKFC